MDVLSKPEIIRAIADALSKTGVFATVAQLDRAVADLQKRSFARAANGENEFSLSKAIRGLCAAQGKVISNETREADLNYAMKALTTNTTTGSYLVPVIQAGEIIQLLNEKSALRRLGPRIWPMSRIDSLRVPTTTAVPTAEWLTQGTQQSPSDPTLGNITLQLRTMRALVALPVELVMTSIPAVDQIISELLSIAMADRESIDFFATSTASGAPVSLYADANTTTVQSNNSANGGPIRYQDLVATLGAAYGAKAAPPFVWAFNPRTFFASIHGMLDAVSRPIIRETAGSDGIQFSLFGFPVVISANIPINQTYGSGSSQSYGFFGNPNYIHLGEDQGLQIQISTEFYFDRNEIAFRSVIREDWKFSNEAGIVLIKGALHKNS